MILPILLLSNLLHGGRCTEDDRFVHQVDLFSVSNQTKLNYLRYAGRGASLAVDGNIRTCAHAGHNPNDIDSVWWRVIMDRVYEVKHIRLFYSTYEDYWKLDNNIVVYVGNNSEIVKICRNFWTTELPFSDFFEIKCRENIFGNTVTLLKNDEWLVICEVQIFAELRTVNLALRRPFAQGGLILSDTVEKPVDANPLTCSTIITRYDALARWKVMLDNIYYVTDVTLVFKQNDKFIIFVLPSRVTIIASDGEKGSQDQVCFDSEETDNVVTNETSFSHKCVKPTLGRYVTVIQKERYPHFHLTLCEFEVYTRDIPEILPPSPPPCHSPKYKCRDSKVCVDKDLLCDGTNDCPLADDEDIACLGDHEHFKCKRTNNKIPTSQRCDGNWQCPDYSDEQYCYDLHQEPMLVTFQGDSKYYICSDFWLDKYSAEICDEYNRDFVETKKVNMTGYDIKNILKVTTDPTTNVHRNRSLTALWVKSETCYLKTLIAIRCTVKEDLVNTCGKRAQEDPFYGPYILWGDKAVHGAWPWHAKVSEANFASYTTCGGSILNNRWILTAAHCFSQNVRIGDIDVQVGSLVSMNLLIMTYRVTHLIRHPNFHDDHVSKEKTNDIALLRLKTHISYSKYVRPICLPETTMDQEDLWSFQHCVMVGFGWVNRDWKRPEFLQQVRMHILPNEVCWLQLEYNVVNPKAYTFYKETKYMCAGKIPLLHGANFCNEDDGGALVCKASNGVWTQVGVASFNAVDKNSVKCSSSIFVRVDQFLDFIHSTMRKEYS